MLEAFFTDDTLRFLARSVENELPDCDLSGLAALNPTEEEKKSVL